MTSEPGESPLFSVVSGRPDAEDLAALTAVLAARQRAGAAQAAAAQAAARTGRSAWLDRAALTRAPLRPGPGAWRRSGLPA
jgi:Acyl-CoA carboxylase epsilon subunit